MGRRSVIRILCAAAASLLLACCVKPAAYEQFVRADQAIGGLYSFKLDLSDTLVRYDISLYIADTLANSIPVYAVWSNADSLSFEEMVYIDKVPLVQPYRTGVTMTRPGEWKLDLRPMNVPADFRGIGVICRRMEL